MPRSHKPASQRQLRVAEEIRHALAQTLERGEMRDPDLVGRVITVTEVKVSPDLKNATVYVMPLGGFDIELVLKAMTRARSFFRHEVAKAVDLRVAPNLWFEEDKSFAEAQKIETILASPEVKRDLDHPDEQSQGDGA